MARLSLRPIAFRHVVFPDPLDPRGRAINLAQGQPEPFLPSRASHNLSLDEQQCIRWLFDQGGLSAEDYRPETLRRRIPACLRALRVESVREVPAAIERHPFLLKSALSALVIGVTSFFRDPPVFQTLHQSILPALLARSSGPRVWSIGCSDGAELYSVAMLLAESGGLHRATLLGTDCRAEAIARAREGCYDPASVRNLPQPYLGRYLTFSAAGWHVHAYLRTVIQWRTGNVMRTPEPGTWDLILCRNLAIYMQTAATRRLWAQVEQSLRPGGILVLGKAERALGASTLSAVAPCIYRCDRS